MQESRKSAREYASRAIRSEIDSIILESNLSDEESEIIRLRFGKGWSIVKIAQHMCLSEKTVGRRIERAYDKMYKAILTALPF